MADGSYITDRHHLSTVIQAGLVALLELEDAWLDEDHGACAPRSGERTRSDARPDQTSTIATAPHRYRDRDHLGRSILHLVDKLRTTVADHQPRHTGGPCNCCDTETATHGRDHRGRPTDCHACWRYLRRNGERCNAEVHKGRPQIRWCQCPPECCEVCPDHAEKDRSLSRRCRARKDRDLWQRVRA